MDVAWGPLKKSAAMDLTTFFARFWGAFFLIFGCLFLLTGYLGKVIDMTEDRSFIVSTGYLTLLMGLVTVILHNVWRFDWPVVITVLGWSTLLKGVLKVGFPDLIMRRAQAFRHRQTLSAAALVALGGWLFWLSL